MAKFRNAATGNLAEAEGTGDATVSQLHDRAIGDLIAEARGLSQEQIEHILAYQREHGTRFGEAAIALGLARNEDVLWALSQQFHYHLSSEHGSTLSSELVLAVQPFGRQAEALRALRSQILLRMAPVGTEVEVRRALAIVSPDSGDGKTFFAANLAVAFSQLGGRTLLVDADMRNPRQHQVFGVDNSSGLSGLLSGRNSDNVIRSVAGVPSLYVLPVGATPPNPLELVERPAFGLLVRELLSKFDHVIVDTPAACFGSDYAVLAVRCGSALVVTRKHSNRLDALDELTHQLSQTPVKLAGVVLNEFQG
ncbi:polysaccharide biosynthesis tyrosine autokinase [Rivibacter subsaxonicus]|uniref:Chain length determinant protein tyrosine kinase EpsG n=1 Tax=Rivibacter subsaxonicus TaxID=457575 RepID=A0A4Q7VZP2_9BURK|nr:polysaccharide biosynthesis tyrosine autokinase [Rivibacter subsaxonicus]RZU02260.1 chain length determinant protein tyrosine kinase EpsG [Rivibacter subsaxonicus]